MLIESLALDDRIKKVIIEQDGIRELFPPQVEAINQGLLTGENLVISIPTAAGKTLLAELAALKHVIELGGKVIYLCPLRALASEKFNNLKRFETLGIRIAVTSGDYDSADSYLPRYDIIVSTNEKMDALLRHQVSWIRDQVSLIVIDECHLLNDQHRGPTLEILMARLLTENAHSQILALSATIGNADDLAEWLEAKLVQSDWRPVPLKEGIYFEDQITYADFTSREVPFRRKDQLTNIALDSVHSQEQILIFTPSRRSAVSTAERIGINVEPLIEPREAKHLADLSSHIVRNLSDPLSLKLAETTKRGVTFHHAGLNSRQRDLVEQAFKKGLIKVLCATPTLAAGVNLPAKRVVVSSVYRYSIEEGSHPIKTLEYKQMSGRAGRPQFDSEGEALLLAKQDRAVNWLMDRYILRDPEAVYSKLAARPALRRAVLGLIASKVVPTVHDLLQFFEKTFYGFQFEAVFLEGKIREVIDLLIGWEMIKPLDTNETLEATLYGLRVSQLYLDPETAATIADGLAKAIEKSMSKIHPVAILDLIMGTPDMVTLSFRKSDEKITVKRFDRFTSRLIEDVPEPIDIEYEFRLRDFRTVLFLWDWIKELPVERLIMRYKIGSGDIQRIVETATWIISAAAEIAQLKRRKNEKYEIYMKAAYSLSDRVKYGIKSDAVSLTRIKGIGRKRARILLEHGIRDIHMLLNLSVSELSQMSGFGTELAKTTLELAKELTESTRTESRLGVDLENFFD
ncbi:MAG: DEAD/DEAH box helicase [Candidatus Heimdallarchaeota archaeon]|nr:MAG: DEAD/DEAH box helicase [Candidatus Heimdallarchaeota archaeon]